MQLNACLRSDSCLPLALKKLVSSNKAERRKLPSFDRVWGFSQFPYTMGWRILTVSSQSTKGFQYRSELLVRIQNLRGMKTRWKKLEKCKRFYAAIQVGPLSQWEAKWLAGHTRDLCRCRFWTCPFQGSLSTSNSQNFLVPAASMKVIGWDTLIEYFSNKKTTKCIKPHQTP